MSPQRIMALLMVMGLALLVYALAERKLRQQGRLILKQVLNLRPVHQQIHRLFGLEVANCYVPGL